MDNKEQQFYKYVKQNLDNLSSDDVSDIYHVVSRYLSDAGNSKHVELYKEIKKDLENIQGVKVDEFYQNLQQFANSIRKFKSERQRTLIETIKTQIANHHISDKAVRFFSAQPAFKDNLKHLEWLSAQSPGWLAKAIVEGAVLTDAALKGESPVLYQKRKRSPLGAKIASLMVSKLNTRKNDPLLKAMVTLPEGMEDPVAGDIIGIFPQNPDSIVERLKASLRHTDGEVLRQYRFSKPASAERTFVPEEHDADKVYSYEDALKHVTTNRSSEEFLHLLYNKLKKEGTSVRHPLYKKLEKLVKLAESSHVTAYEALRKTHIAEFLEAFPGVITLDELIEAQGKEHRRVYTISKLHYNENLKVKEVELTISSSSGYKTPSYSFVTDTPLSKHLDYKGAAVGFFEDIRAKNKPIDAEIFTQSRTFGNSVKGAIQKAKDGTLTKEEKAILKKPLTMVAAGSGISGVRSILQERMILKHKFGLEIGPSELVFGMRNRNTDELYKDDFDSYLTNGILESIQYVESRTINGTPKKEYEVRYVQDYLRRNWEKEKAIAITKGERKLVLCGDQIIGDEILNAIAYKNNNIEQEDFDFTDRLEGWQVGTQQSSLIPSASGSRLLSPYDIPDIIAVKASTPHFRFSPLYRSSSHTVYRKHYRDKRDRPNFLMNVSSALGVSKIIRMTRNIDGIDEIASFFNQIKGILGASLATGVFAAGTPFVGFGMLGMSGEVIESEEEKLKLAYAKRESKDLVVKIAREYGYSFSDEAMRSEELFAEEASEILGAILKQAKNSNLHKSKVNKIIASYSENLSNYTKEMLLYRASVLDHRGAQLAGFPAMFLMFAGMLSGLSESATKVAHEAGRTGLEKTVANFNIATTSIFAPANLLMAIYAGVRFKSGLFYEEVAKRDHAAMKHFMHSSTSLRSFSNLMNNQRALNRRSYQHYGAATAIFQSMLAASGFISLMSISGVAGASAALSAAPIIAGVGAAGAVLAVAHRIRADVRRDKLNGNEDKVLGEHQWVSDGKFNDGERITGRYNFAFEYGKIGKPGGYKNRAELAEKLQDEYKNAENDLVYMKAVSLAHRVLRNRTTSLGQKNYTKLTPKARFKQFEKRAHQRWNRISNLFRKIFLMGSRSSLDMTPELAKQLRSNETIHQYSSLFGSDTPFTSLLNRACKGKLNNSKGEFDIGKIEVLIKALDRQSFSDDNYKHRGKISNAYKRYFPTSHRKYFSVSAEHNHNQLVNRIVKHVSKFAETNSDADRYFTITTTKTHPITRQSYTVRTGFKLTEFILDAHLKENTWQREAYAAAASPFVVDYLKNAAKVNRADALEHITKLANEKVTEEKALLASELASSESAIGVSNKWRERVNSQSKNSSEWKDKLLASDDKVPLQQVG